MFAYYAKWILNFSDKIRPLVENTKFTLETKALEAFKQIKQELEVIAVKLIDESLPFRVECDASDVAISAALNQGGRPVVFMSKTLQGSELKYHIIEKEAMTIMEAVRKWSHYLTLITDLRSVVFMFSNEKRNKIKNAKIQEWRLELSVLDYTIKYSPVKENGVLDILSHAYTCSLINSSTFYCWPSQWAMPPRNYVTLTLCYRKNLPFSTEDVKKVCSSYRICAEVKPCFYISPEGTLIKVTRPMEKLSIDFKWSVPFVTSLAWRMFCFWR